jgi:alpha-beta hydrolase superfamily lysophospholipase
LSLATFTRTNGANAEKVLVLTSRTRLPDAKKRLVIYSHSSGGSYLEPSGGAYRLMDRIADLGAPVLSADFSGPKQWGNDASRTKVDEHIAYATGGEFNAKVDKVALLGTSMGALHLLGWARANPSKVAAIALLYPAVDLQWVHDNGAAADTEAAFGGSLASFNTAVASHDPMVNPQDFQQFPIRVWYSDSDSVVSTARQRAWITPAGASARVLKGAAHADMSKVPTDEVRDFLRPYL